LSERPIPGTRFVRNMERAAPRFPIWPCTRWGFPCLRAYACSGGLLLHLFTLTPLLLESQPIPFRPHSSVKGTTKAWFQKERGGLFSVALSVRVPRGTTSRVYPQPIAAVTRHRARWCSDFPPPLGCPRESDSPPFQNREEDTAPSKGSQEELEPAFSVARTRDLTRDLRYGRRHFYLAKTAPE
jgi:hypothetical protein